MASLDLDKDVMLEILSRLPVKSLMRFRCVCKLWCTLIQEPSFIAKHLCLNQATSMKKNNSHLLISGCDFSCNEPLFGFLFGEPLEALDAYCMLSYEALGEVDGSVYKGTSYDKKRLNVMTFTSSCNGIFCVFDRGILALLFNPAIREFKALPFSQVTRPRCGYDALTMAMGLGFDFKTNDYKVVRIVFLPFDAGRRHLVEVYTNYNDSWREIDNTFQVSTFIDQTTMAYLNGVCHWCARDNGDQMIISFDMGDEVFQKKELPDIGIPFWNVMGTISVLNESIAFTALIKDEVEAYLDIWVMNEDGVKEIWTKKMKLGWNFEDQRLRGVWNGKIVWENKNRRLITYDTYTQEIKDHGIRGSWYSYSVFVYEESLISFKGGSKL